MAFNTITNEDYENLELRLAKAINGNRVSEINTPSNATNALHMSRMFFRMKDYESAAFHATHADSILRDLGV
jgi:hypothetical protein